MSSGRSLEDSVPNFRSDPIKGGFLGDTSMNTPDITDSLPHNFDPGIGDALPILGKNYEKEHPRFKESTAIR